MRLLTPEQQAAVRPGQEMGGLTKQAPWLLNEEGDLNPVQPHPSFIDHTKVENWRHAVACGLIRRSRLGEWEPFRKSDGCEKWIACEWGIAWANDGVHILIRTVEGNWITRSAQVVNFRQQTPWAPTINAVKYLKKVNPETKPTRSLADEYLSL